MRKVLACKPDPPCQLTVGLEGCRLFAIGSDPGCEVVHITGSRAQTFTGMDDKHSKQLLVTLFTESDDLNLVDIFLVTCQRHSFHVRGVECNPPPHSVTFVL